MCQVQIFSFNVTVVTVTTYIIAAVTVDNPLTVTILAFPEVVTLRGDVLINK